MIYFSRIICIFYNITGSFYIYIFIQYYHFFIIHFFLSKIKTTWIKHLFFVSNLYDSNHVRCLITRITKTERFSHCTWAILEKHSWLKTSLATVFTADSNPSLLRQFSAIHPFRLPETDDDLSRRKICFPLDDSYFSAENDRQHVTLYPGRKLNI